MELFSLAEIITAVMMVLGGQKGYEIYKRKRHSNSSHDRRSNSFAQADRDFIQGCFETQTKEMGLTMKSDRLELLMNVKEVVQEEGAKIRVAVRDNR